MNALVNASCSNSPIPGFNSLPCSVLLHEAKQTAAVVLPLRIKQSLTQLKGGNAGSEKLNLYNQKCPKILFYILLHFCLHA